MNSKDVSLANDFVKARDLRNELRRLEESIARRADRSPVTLEDERAMGEMQARADSAYQAAGRRAPPALPLERPGEYHRRLLDGVKGYSPRWKSADLNVVTDETALSVIEQQVYADAARNGRTAGLKPLEIRERVSEGHGGHKVIEFDGGEEAHFTRQFSRDPRLGVFRPREEYEAMSRDAQLSRIGALVHEYRPTMAAPRAAF